MVEVAEQQRKTARNSGRTVWRSEPKPRRTRESDRESLCRGTGLLRGRDPSRPVLTLQNAKAYLQTIAGRPRQPTRNHQWQSDSAESDPHNHFRYKRKPVRLSICVDVTDIRRSTWTHGMSF